MIEIAYKIENAGWATGTIANAEKAVNFDISYLHDSLKELAQSAIQIQEKEEKSITFMSEPGEHLFKIMRVNNSKLKYELRWYEDWFSWNLVAEQKYELVLTGETTIPKFVNQVRNILIKIFDELGPIEYKKKWVEHEFPMKEFEILT